MGKKTDKANVIEITGREILIATAMMALSQELKLLRRFLESREPKPAAEKAN